MDLDFSGIKDNKPDAGKKTEFEIIPADTKLEARLVGLKPGKTQNEKKYLEAEFIILEGDHEYTNRHIWTRLYTDTGINWKIRDLMKAAGVFKEGKDQQPFNMSDVLNKQYEIVVDVNSYNPQKPKNEVKYINASRMAKNQGSKPTGFATNAGSGGGGFSLK